MDTNKKTYEDGLNDAWNAARKIVCVPEDGGLPGNAIQVMFAGGCGYSFSTIFCNYSASEAVAKISEYENRTRFEVGDVCRFIYGTDYFVITQINGTKFVGHRLDCSIVRGNLDELFRTDHRIPQFIKLLQSKHDLEIEKEREI